MPQKDGALWFKVNSPEGERALALYEWAPGTKFGECLSEDTAHRIGAHFAEMHLHGLEWAGPEHRFSSSKVKEFTVWMPALLDFVYDRPDDLRDYPMIAERLSERLDQLAAARRADGRVPPRFSPQQCPCRRAMAASPCSISMRRGRIS